MKRFLFGSNRGDGQDGDGDSPGKKPGGDEANDVPFGVTDIPPDVGESNGPKKISSIGDNSGKVSNVGPDGQARDSIGNVGDVDAYQEVVEEDVKHGGRMKKVFGGGKSAFGKLKAGLGGIAGGRRKQGGEVQEGVVRDLDIEQAPSAPPGPETNEEELYALSLRQAEKRLEVLSGEDGNEDAEGGQGRNSRQNSGALQIPGPGVPRSPVSPNKTAQQYPDHPSYPSNPSNSGNPSARAVSEGPGADYFAQLAYGQDRRQGSAPSGPFSIPGGTGAPGSVGMYGSNAGGPQGFGQAAAKPVGWGNVFGDENAAAMGPGFTVKAMYRPPPPIYEIAPEIADMLKRANYYAEEALSQDERANYGQAQEQYMKALGLLIPAIKQLESGKTTARREQEKQKAGKLAKQILSRCETIKPFVEANATVAALEGSSAPKTMPTLPSNGDTDDGNDRHRPLPRRRHAGVNLEASTSSEEDNLTASADSTVQPPPPPPPPPEDDALEDEQLLLRIGNMMSPAARAGAPRPGRPTMRARGISSTTEEQDYWPQKESTESSVQRPDLSQQKQPPPLPPRVKSNLQPDLTETNGRWECGVCTTWRADTVTKNCRHLHCSNCISASLMVLKQCPTCDAPCTASDLIKVTPPPR